MFTEYEIQSKEISTSRIIFVYLATQYWAQAILNNNPCMMEYLKLLGYASQLRMLTQEETVSLDELDDFCC